MQTNHIYRRKYIRFFVSSTFADMERERNIVRRVLDGLRHEYQARYGWQVEYVDLRWGISREAGDSKRTMSICLDELRLCQELSPRPNFIVLLGERPGWWPMPEVLSDADMQRVKEGADWEELLWLELYYAFNENVLPEGVWELRHKRETDFGSTVDTAAAEDLLRKRFETVFPADSPYRMTATQQEIFNGALRVPDSREHVIAYLRTFERATIPVSERAVFSPDCNERSDSAEWRHRIIENTDPSNVVIAEGLDWQRYISGGYAEALAGDIERKVRRIIDREIAVCASRDEFDNEILHHRYYAAHLSENFVGRSDFINMLVDSIGTSDSPLLVYGKPGVGKSTMTGRLVTELDRRGYCVCVRFCSLLSADRTHEGLMRSITAELERCSSDARPKVILVDAVNELELGNSFENKRLGWLAALARKYRTALVVTVAEGDTVESVLPGFISLELEPLNPVRAMGVIEWMLRGMGRRMTAGQTDSLRAQLEQSGVNQGGLYLRLMASRVARLASWEPMPPMASTIGGMVEDIANYLSRPEQHGSFLTRRTLALLATIPEGLDYTNLSLILSSDIFLREALAKSSFYDWDSTEATLPPVYLSRLFHELNGILVDIRNGSGGARIVIRHPEIRKALVEKWLTPSEKVAALRLAFDFFNKEWCNDNQVALHEVVSACIRLILGDNNQDNRTLAASLGMSRLSDPVYIFMMQKASRQKLNLLYMQYYKALSRFTTHRGTIEKYLRTQADVRRWPDLLSVGHAMALAVNMPDSTNVRNYALRRPESARVLSDELRNITTDDYIIQSLPDAEEMRFMRLTAAGDALFYIYPVKNHNNICRMDVRTGLSQIVSGDLPPDISDFAISRDGSVRAVLLPEGEGHTKLYVVNGTQAWCKVFHARYIEVSVSPDGNWIALVCPGHPVEFIKAEGKIYTSLSDSDALKCETLRFSDDSLWIWTLHDGCISLYSRDIFGGTGIKCSFKLNKEQMPALWGKKRIVSTSGKIITVYNEEVCEVFMLYLDKDTFAYQKLYYPACSFFNIYNAADGLDKITAVYGSESGQIGEIEGEGDNSIRIRQTASVFPVDAVCEDLSVALSTECGCLFDLRRMMRETLYLSSFDDVGLNNMTSSLKSDKMLVSIGKNRALECGTIQFPVLTERLADGSWRERQLRVEGLKSTRYTLSSAISPDGTLAAFFQDEPSNSIVLYDLKSDKGKTIAEISLGVVAMTFTSDSRFLIAVTGDYNVSFTPVILVFDREGKRLYIDFLEYYADYDLMDVMGATHIRVTEDNRWLIFGSSAVSVYDLVSRKLIQANCADAEIWAAYGHKDVKYGMLVDRTPLMFWDYGQKSLLTSYGRKHCEVRIPSGEVSETENPLTLVGLDVDTRLLLDRKSNTLFIKSLTLTEPVRVADSVVMAFPCYDGKHFYAYHTDRRISLNTYEGRELQYAYPLNYVPVRFQVTADGLAIGRSDGHVAFFRPDPRFGVNSRMDILGLCRWDLDSCNFSEPYAICPRCGTHIAGCGTYGDKPCPGCGTPINVITCPDRPSVI